MLSFFRFRFGEIYLNGSRIDYTRENGKFEWEFSSAIDRAVFGVRNSWAPTNMLDKTHVVNFAQGSEEIIDDDVFMTTGPDPMTRNTMAATFRLDFKLSGVDASIIASTDALFLLNGTNNQRQTVKTTIIKCIAYSDEEFDLYYF